MSRKKNTGFGSVYYNKERNNWLASFNVLDPITKKEN